MKPHDWLLERSSDQHRLVMGCFKAKSSKGAEELANWVMVTDACVLYDNQHRVKHDETPLDK